ncbi:YecH family protein [Photobacterium swingsii]|uniref:YecH family metal-binding protein n=1 Tax=Photobacterium swingsii TaxID=680026 RepID=UPI003D0E916E
MTESVHAHNVLNMLLEDGADFSLDSLRQAVVALYGEDVRFHTCSLQDLTFDALLTFLLDRRKVIQDGDKIMANRERMCSH